MWDMWNYKSSPSTRVGEVQWFKPLLKCVEFYSDELKKWRWISSSIYWNLKARGRLQWNRESRQEFGKWNMQYIQYLYSPIMSHWLTLTWKPYSSMQQCPIFFLPEWPRLPGCLERNFLWTSKSHEIERWIKKLKKQNCHINPMKMPSTPRTVYPLFLWFLSNVLMSRHLRLMIRLAMAVLFKWNALQSILLTFLIIKIKQISF